MILQMEKFHSWPHVMGHSQNTTVQNYIKLSSVSVYMKYKWISCLDLGPVSKRSIMHMQISEKYLKSEMLLVPSILS